MDLQRYLEDVTARDWQASDPGEDGPVRLAMVGLGWWVREKSIPAVAQSDFCETRVLVSRDTADARALAHETDAAVGISGEEYHDGVAIDEYDAVYVCTPNATHLPYVETAAELGKDVLCEKPMEASVDRAERMVDAVEGSDSRLMVAYRMHTEPAVRRVVDLLDDGLLGDPVAVHGHMSQPLLSMIPDPDQWRLDPDMAGPGASVTDIGLYPLNTARFVLGADPVSVTAQMHSADAAFGDVPDQHAAFTIRFDDGTQAACTASQHAAYTGHLRVVGTDGELVLEPVFLGQPEQTLTLHSDGRRLEVADGRRDVMRDEMTEEFDYFADRVLRDAPIHPDGDHALVDMRALEAIYDAAETGTTVSV